jgi:hypothetical protein
MSQRTAKDRLLESLPPEQRSYFDRCLHRLSPNPDDPLIALFAIITETDNSNTALIEAKLAAFEQLEKQRDGQQAKDRNEYLKAISKGFEALRGKTPWKHLIASKFIGAIIWTLTVAGLTTYFVETKVKTVDPAFHAHIDDVGSKINQRIDGQAQLANLRINQTLELVQESIDTLNRTHVTTASQTLIGKGLSLYVTHLDEKNITVSVDGRTITVPHNLTSEEFLQLDLALKIAKRIR